MKKLIQVTEVESEGLIKLMGKRVTFFCLNYIYSGDLVGVNDSCVLLENASIVYETGAFTDAKFKDEQKLNIKEFYLMKSTIESFGVFHEK